MVRYSIPLAAAFLLASCFELGPYEECVDEEECRVGEICDPERGVCVAGRACGADSDCNQGEFCTRDDLCADRPPMTLCGDFNACVQDGGDIESCSDDICEPEGFSCEGNGCMGMAGGGPGGNNGPDAEEVCDDYCGCLEDSNEATCVQEVCGLLSPVRCVSCDCD